MKKEHGITSEQGIKKEENKKESNEDKGKGEAGIMICDLSNQPNRTADYSSQNDKSETLRAIEECGFKHPPKIQHKCIPKGIELVDNQISNKEEKSASSSRKWDPDDGICSLVQLTNVELRKKWNLSMAKSTIKRKNQQVLPGNGTQMTRFVP